MPRSTKLNWMGKFWGLVTVIVGMNLVVSAVSGAEAVFEEVPTGHCEQILRREFGPTPFQRQIRLLAAEQTRARRNWQLAQQSLVRQLRKSHYWRATERLAHDLLTSLGTPAAANRRAVRGPSVASPRSVAMKTLLRTPTRQWWRLSVAAKEYRQTIRQSIESFSQLLDVTQMFSRLSAKLQTTFAPLAQHAHTPAAQAISNSHRETSAQPDAYWEYYADCDHWQVTFKTAEQ